MHVAARFGQTHLKWQAGSKNMSAMGRQEWTFSVLVSNV